MYIKKRHQMILIKECNLKAYVSFCYFPALFFIDSEYNI